MSTFKIGILGPGSIACKVSDTLAQMKDFQVYAVASRSKERAKAFGNRYHCEKIYDTYEALASDQDVDLIYIATPHSHHYEQTMLCLNAGKPCLVEKAFSYNRKTAGEMIALSEQKHLFLGEAYWSRYNPMYHLLKDILIEKRLLGRLHSITVSMGYDVKGIERLTNPELAGGALLDIGLYPLGFVTYLLGSQPVRILSSCARFETGVDAQETMILLYPDGINAHIFATALYGTERTAYIYGENGFIKVNEFSCPTSIEYYSNANELMNRIVPSAKQISGYEYEFLSARTAIEQGRCEPKEMPHAETLALMEHMDKLRANWGIRYPFE